MASTRKIKRTTRKELGSQGANCGWEISFRINCRRLGFSFMDITPMSLSSLRLRGYGTRRKIYSAGYGWKERYWLTISRVIMGRRGLICRIGLWNSSDSVHCSQSGWNCCQRGKFQYLHKGLAQPTVFPLCVCLWFCRLSYKPNSVMYISQSLQPPLALSSSERRIEGALWHASEMCLLKSQGPF